MLFDCGLSPRTVKQGFEIYSAPWKKTLHAVGGVCKGQGDPLGLGLGVAVGAKARPTPDGHTPTFGSASPHFYKQPIYGEPPPPCGNTPFGDM